MKFPQLQHLFDSYDRFVITCHETPDGDAVGSEVALYHALSNLGKQVEVINADPVPDKYTFLTETGIVGTIEEIEVDREYQDTALIILDTNDIHNIGTVGTKILPAADEYFIIDHHESGDDIETGRVIEVASSSTCEILYKIFREFEIPLTLPMAQALYAGLIYDTGCFAYPKTTAFTFEAAEELVLIGVKPYELYSAIYESNSISSLKLQSAVLAGLELYFNQQVAVQIMLKETLDEAGALYEEADAIINFPLRSENIRVSIFFKENNEGLLRCSLRSKGNINVSQIAQKYGGGGHKTAAGFKSPYPVDEMKQMILADLHPYF